MKKLMQESRNRHKRAAVMAMVSVMISVADISIIFLTMNVVSDALKPQMSHESVEKSNYRRSSTILGVESNFNS